MPINIFEQLGGLVGTVFGGPGGGAVGRTIGEVVSGALPSSGAPAPAPKPLIKSRTAWVNLALGAAAAVLSWGVGYDWTQIVSPTTAIVIVSFLNLALRLVTAAPIGVPPNV